MAVSFTSNWFVLPHFGVEQKPEVMVAISIIYTAISMVRQYGFRRIFAQFGEKENAYTLLVRGVNRLRN